MMKRVYFGEDKCHLCPNKAYYENNHKIYCGIHCSKKKYPSRQSLPKRTKLEYDEIFKKRMEQEQKDIDEQQAINQSNKQLGHVIVTKLKMMKEPEHHKGYLKVFPNNKHQNRKDGFGCSSLSPMRLGPVHHNQPNLPICKNIENFHQGSKCFKEEAILENGQYVPSLLFYKNQKKFFLDDVPHRHKYKGINKENPNIPLFFVWIDSSGKEHHLSYVESRQFYCYFYEQLARQTEDFKKLKTMRNNGINLQIIGYDGRSIHIEGIETEYLNPLKPFGHELVLYTLLMIDDPLMYPWQKYKMFNF